MTAATESVMQFVEDVPTLRTAIYNLVDAAVGEATSYDVAVAIYTGTSLEFLLLTEHKRLPCGYIWYSGSTYPTTGRRNPRRIGQFHVTLFHRNPMLDDTRQATVIDTAEKVILEVDLQGLSGDAVANVSSDNAVDVPGQVGTACHDVVFDVHDH